MRKTMLIASAIALTAAQAGAAQTAPAVKTTKVGSSVVRAATPAQNSSRIAGTTVVVTLLALTAVTFGTIKAFQSGGSNSRPASP